MASINERFTIKGFRFPSGFRSPRFTIKTFAWPVASTAVKGGVYNRTKDSWVRLWIKKSWDRRWRKKSWNRLWRWREMAIQIPSKTLIKSESEDRYYGFDFSESPEIENGAIVSSAVMTGGAGLTFGTPDVVSTFDSEWQAGQGVVVQISGGTAGEDYHFACVATLDNGSVLTIPGRLVVVADNE
jgi:hypothetical protein